VGFTQGRFMVAPFIGNFVLRRRFSMAGIYILLIVIIAILAPALITWLVIFFFAFVSFIVLIWALNEAVKLFTERK
jgi:hypothetical protein